MASDLILSTGFSKLAGKHCILGIDEAGRGPVLGPMLYSVAVCLSDKYKDDKVQHDSLSTAADSKTLTEEQRERLFEEIESAGVQEWLAYGLDVIEPHYISTCMLGRQKISLNEVSHNSAMSLIQAAISAGIVVDHVYVDTVGLPERYQEKLQRRFPGTDITVSKKADSLFQIVSVASICAKVTRDRRLKAWAQEGSVPEKGVGSGYPGDPITKEFLRSSMHPIFGFPDIVRHSWQTADTVLQKDGAKMTWPDDEDAGQPAAKKSRSLDTFYAKEADPILTLRHSFFADRYLSNVTVL